jgi:hypothetical protein
MEPDDEMEGFESFEGVDRDGSPAIASVSARSSFDEDTDEPQTPQKRLGGVMSVAQEWHFMGDSAFCQCISFMACAFVGIVVIGNYTTHSRERRSRSCERVLATRPQTCTQECAHGTQECVRHDGQRNR